MGTLTLLYEKYRELLWRIAMGVLQDAYLAEDAVQDAFLKVGQNLDKIGDIESCATRCYLIVIARHAAIDIYRKRGSWMEREISLEEWGDICGKAHVQYTEQAYEDAECAPGIIALLTNLPVKYQEVFLLKYYNCLENKEIAQTLGIPEGTVRQRIARGKKLIEKAMIGPEGKNG